MQEPALIHRNFKRLRSKKGLSIPKLLQQVGLDISANTYASYEDSRENIPKYPTKKILLNYYSEQFNKKITIEDLHEIDMTEENYFDEDEFAPESTKNEITELQRIHLEIELTQAQALKAKAEAEKQLAEAEKLKAQLAIIREHKNN